jgi:hypothetical protein
MPTVAPGSAPTLASEAVYPAEPVSNPNQNVVFISMLVVTGILIVFVLRL